MTKANQKVVFDNVTPIIKEDKKLNKETQRDPRFTNELVDQIRGSEAEISGLKSTNSENTKLVNELKIDQYVGLITHIAPLKLSASGNLTKADTRAISEDLVNECNMSKANAKLLKDNYTALKLQITQMGISGEGVDDLVRELASDIAQGNLTTAEAAQTISYLIDPYRLAMAGGASAMNQEYTKYTDRINATQSGIADAKNLVTQYLGLDSAIAFESNGVIEQYAALLRADAAQGEGVTTNRETIINQLQNAHDTMFPNYEGSQHALWSAPLYRTFQTITGKAALSNQDKKNVDIISQKVGGDMTLFAGEIRKTYENDPTYQDKVLGDMTGVFKQDVSGVFTGQSLVG